MAEKQDDLKRVRELIELMKENDLVELEIADGESKIHLKRPQAGFSGVAGSPAMAPVPTVSAFNPEARPPSSVAETNLKEIRSPIVGTFYAAGNPEADSYVQVGDKVRPDTIVCIIEAMKVMNEIKAEISGTIAEICIEDGQSVEYGQVLFRVHP